MKQVPGTFDRASLLDKTPKTMTRGNAPQEAAVQPENAQEVNKEPTFFSVDERAHEVFHTLFHSPNNPDTPGEIPWADFLHSMVKVGFSAEKMHGSAWKFAPRSLDVNLHRSIQFHEPHLSSKLPISWARRFGRRLARAYGWDPDMFRLGQRAWDRHEWYF